MVGVLIPLPIALWRRIVINQKQISKSQYTTLTLIKAATNLVEISTAYCLETKTQYEFVLAGSTYTANDTSVLITGDGGDTRWVGISGQYIYLKNTTGYFVGTDLETAADEMGYITTNADSPMILTGGVITEGTAGTFTVASLTALLRKTDSLTGILVPVSLAEQANQAITSANTTYFVCLDYNGGTPQIVLDTTNPYSRTTAPDRTQIPIGKVMKDGADAVHFISGGFSFQDGVRKLHQRAKSLRNLELANGSAISYFGTDNFKMTAGVAYAGINDITLDVFDSSTTNFTPVRGDGGAGFTEGAGIKVIDFAHYDDGAGGLGNIGFGRYGTHWVYKHADDGHVYVRLGMGSYRLAEAEVEAEPTKPDHLADFGLLIGCIIAPQAGGSFTSIQMVTDTFFSGTSVADHAELSNLQGGAVGEYNHLTDAELTFSQHQTAFGAIADATHTLITTNVNVPISLTRADVQTVTIDTFANQAIPTNSRIVIQGYGSGVKTIESVAGVTLNGVDNNSFVLDAQYSSCELACYATNTWIITGGVN